MRIVMIRHGQTPSNVQGLLDTGAPGPGLTPLGTRQAEAIPGALGEREVDAVVVSSLLRTSLTADPLLNSRGIRSLALPGLAEIEAGDLEMAADSASQQRYMETAFAWTRGQLHRRMPGGGDGHAFFTRFDQAIAEIAASGWQNAVVVSHGAAIRTWSRLRVAGAGIEALTQHHLANTAALELEGDPSTGWRLLDWTSDPIGGADLASEIADDPTGETVQQGSRAPE